MLCQLMFSGMTLKETILYNRNQIYKEYLVKECTENLQYYYYLLDV